MINNKIICIEKKTSYINGYNLLKPKKIYKSFSKASFIDINELANAITFADEVNIILEEPVIPRRLVEEIEWARKYIRLNVILKSQEIAKRYTMFDGANIAIDPKVSINYIAVIGKKKEIYAILGDDMLITDNYLNEAYFNGKGIKANYSLLDEAQEAYIINSNNILDASIIKELRKRSIPFYYVVDEKHFSYNTTKFVRENDLKLLVAKKASDGIIIRDKVGYKRAILVDGLVIESMAISNLDNHIFDAYEWLGYDGEVNISDINEELYYCNGSIKSLNLKDQKIVEIDVPLSSLEDFLEERFNKDIVLSYNDYSSEAKSVKYVFTLIPPLANDKLEKSSLYSNIYLELDNYNKLANESDLKLISEFENIDNAKDTLLPINEELMDSIDKLKKSIEAYQFEYYYVQIGNIYNLLEGIDKGLIGYCLTIFDRFNHEFTDDRNNKIEDEIKGYEAIIEEKKSLIQNGKDIISNKRRVEILEGKIKRLRELGNKFRNKVAVDTTTSDLFKAKLISILNDSYRRPKQESLSIANIVNNTSDEKAIFESVIEKSLKDYADFIKEALEIFKRLSLVKIPYGKTAYDKDGKHYIIIDELDEYNTYLELKKSFEIGCLVRR